MATMQQEFLDEYTAEENVKRYRNKTAGHGISYLLEHDYIDIYLDAIDKHLRTARSGRGLRVLEFGCGAGMNLLHLVSVLERRGMPVEFACGTDFSDALIQSANLDAKEMLPPHLLKKVRFCVARNENLIGDMKSALGKDGEALEGSFDIILGVNTIRYSHRLAAETKSASDIRDMLREGGVCIVIDMNDKFPAFRSRVRDSAPGRRELCHLPSLEEYARPFSSVGLEVLRKENFCWIPHSAGQSLTAVMRVMTPVLDRVARRRAMRSLVVSRKSGQHNGQART